MKNNSTRFTGKDGQDYESSLKMLVADELFELKASKKISNYDTDVNVNSWISCDFLVYLNKIELYLDLNEVVQDKLDYFKDSGILFENITSIGRIQEIIDKIINLYKIPEKPTVITAHANPDADAVSSCVAVYNYLKSLGVKSYIKLEGEISDNLKAFIPENSDKPINVEQVIVLDSGYEPERLGWEIPKLPLINIDHHLSRISENDPDNKIFVFDSCCTASILIRYFGIRDDILLAGIYGDTLFRRNLMETTQLLITLNVDDEVSKKIINIVDQINSGIVLSSIQKSKVVRHRNGFMYMELVDSVPSWVLTDIMSIISRMSESVCLIAENGETRLRTSNSNIDVSKIAEQFGGGGHPFAAGCFVTKRSKLKKIIRKVSHET